MWARWLTRSPTLEHAAGNLLGCRRPLSAKAPFTQGLAMTALPSARRSTWLVLLDGALRETFNLPIKSLLLKPVPLLPASYRH